MAKTHGNLTALAVGSGDVEKPESAPLASDEKAVTAAIRDILVDQRQETRLRALSGFSPTVLSSAIEAPDSDRFNVQKLIGGCKQRSRLILSGRLVTSQTVQSVLPWLIIGSAMVVFHPQLFVILAFVSMFSLIALAMIFTLMRFLKQGAALARRISTRVEFGLRAGRKTINLSGYSERTEARG